MRASRLDLAHQSLTFAFNDIYNKICLNSLRSRGIFSLFFLVYIETGQWDYLMTGSDIVLRGTKAFNLLVITIP